MYFVFMGIVCLFGAWFKFPCGCRCFQVQERRSDDDGTVVAQAIWRTTTPEGPVKETEVKSQIVSILFSPVSIQIHITASSLHCSVENSTAFPQLARVSLTAEAITSY
jgi:hypothetical protein